MNCSFSETAESSNDRCRAVAAYNPDVGFARALGTAVAFEGRQVVK
jgi:hypothetical protein